MSPVLKRDKARAIARQYPDMPYTELKRKIRESVPCGKTTAHKAIHYVRDKAKKEGALTTEERAETPQLKVLEEEPRRPSAPPAEIPSELKPLPEEPAPALEEAEVPRPIPELPEAEEGIDVEWMQEVIRKVHQLFLSNEGIPQKYGNTVDSCNAVSDGMFSYLKGTYGVEALQKGSLGMIILGYIGLAGNIGFNILKERRAQAAKKKPKEKKKVKEHE